MPNQLPPDDRIIAARVSHGAEPSAVLLVRRVESLTAQHAEGRWLTEVTYQVPLVERLSGGTSYAAIADLVGDLAAEAKEEHAARVSVVVDITAPGVPFMRLLRDRKVRCAPVMVSDATAPRADARLWMIPHRELISITARLVGERRLQVPDDLPQAKVLAKQLMETRAVRPPRDPMEEWKPDPHQDLAAALQVALWWGERMLRSIVRQPPAPVPVIEIRQPTFDEIVEAQGRRRRRAG